MLIGDIPRNVLAQRLRTEGIHLNSGAFTTELCIDLPDLVDEFAAMYARYPVEDPPGIDDARVRILPPSRWRRHFRRQALPSAQGSRFDPIQAGLAAAMLASALRRVIAGSHLCGR